mmetsp:Transcript_84633/g.218116  ORF Transcript_84633/g.218116 Transcript_84633/m.218116 type:complete len:301 (-) Transcript_84633:658-1560(-)
MKSMSRRISAILSAVSFAPASRRPRRSLDAASAPLAAEPRRSSSRPTTRPSDSKARTRSCSRAVSTLWRSSPMRSCISARSFAQASSCVPRRSSIWRVTSRGVLWPFRLSRSCMQRFCDSADSLATSADISARRSSKPLVLLRRASASCSQPGAAPAFSPFSSESGTPCLSAPRSTGYCAPSPDLRSSTSARRTRSSCTSFRRLSSDSDAMRMPVARTVSTVARTPVMSTCRCVRSSTNICLSASSCSAMLAPTTLIRRFSASFCIRRSSSSCSSRRATRARMANPLAAGSRSCVLASML